MGRGDRPAKSTVKKHSDGPRGGETSKSMDYDRDGPGVTGFLNTCNVRVGGPRGKLRGPKGLKKGFLVQPGAYGAEDGGDVGKVQGDNECSVFESSDSGSKVCSDSGFFLDELNLKEAINRGIVDDDFMMNHVGKRLQEFFLNESDNFMGMFPPSKQPKPKGKKKRGIANHNGSEGSLGVPS